jgi:hypothetical protein
MKQLKPGQEVTLRGRFNPRKDSDANLVLSNCTLVRVNSRRNALPRSPVGVFQHCEVVCRCVDQPPIDQDDVAHPLGIKVDRDNDALDGPQTGWCGGQSDATPK